MDIQITLKISNGMRFSARADAGLKLKSGDRCIFRKDFYCDLGTVLSVGRELDPEKAAELPTVLHIADAGEMEAAAENEQRNKSALKVAADWVERLKLEMKLLNAHYSVDGKIVIFQFTADGRVDFRELVKELSHALSCRIELRQIGVRDETGIFGGISVCGQVMCCSRFLREFNSINVKMAKDQDLSLTPATISGICGRLKCCLKFEHEGYKELEKNMPRKGEWCDSPAGRGRIVDRNLLAGRVSVQTENGNITVFRRDEITVVSPEKKNSGSRDNSGRGGGKENAENSGSRDNSGRGSDAGSENTERRRNRRDRRDREGRGKPSGGNDKGGSGGNAPGNDKGGSGESKPENPSRPENRQPEPSQDGME